MSFKPSQNVLPPCCLLNHLNMSFKPYHCIFLVACFVKKSFTSPCPPPPPPPPPPARARAAFGWITGMPKSKIQPNSKIPKRICIWILNFATQNPTPIQNPKANLHLGFGFCKPKSNRNPKSHSEFALGFGIFATQNPNKIQNPKAKFFLDFGFCQPKSKQNPNARCQNPNAIQTRPQHIPAAACCCVRSACLPAAACLLLGAAS